MRDKRIYTWIFIVLVFFQCCTLIFWGARKEGYNYDELMTYYYASKVMTGPGDHVDFQYQNNFYNQIYTREQYIDTLSVAEGASFFEQPISKQISALIHEDTYMVLVNALMGIGDGRFNKWYAISINVLLFALIQVSLFRLSKKVVDDDLCGILTVAFYGFSIAAVKSGIFLRFYEFFILMALIYLNLGISMMKQEKTNALFFLKMLLSFVAVFYGYCNAEYMIVVAGVFSIAFVGTCIFKRKWKKLVAYCGCYAVAGILFLFNRWERFVVQYKSQGQLYSAIDKLFGGETGEFIKYVILYATELVFDTGIGILVVGWIALYLYQKKKKGTIENTINEYWGMLLFTIIGYIVVIGKIAPWVAWRYGTVMAPLYVVVMSTLVFGLFKKAKRREVIVSIFIGTQLLYFGIFRIMGGIAHGEVKDAVHEQIASEYGNYDAIMFTTGDRGDLYFGSFMWPDNGRVYVTSSEMMEEQTEDRDTILEENEILAYVRSEDEWNSKIESIIQTYGYTDCAMVQDTGEARFLIYLCKRQ